MMPDRRQTVGRTLTMAGGLGMLHVFTAKQDARLVRVLPEGAPVVRSCWMLVHADLQRLPRVRAVIAFLKELVDANHTQF